ncbi:MAG: Omp28-related outer membrane protein, partial [Muribaculaceae bacterium]|nr:Omp28-related outer membrane protein [Muribaculaceae bacterium]
TSTVSLEKSAGRDLSIAVVTQNTDGSAVFVDNINVVHDLKFLASFSNSDRVVRRENIAIKGSIVIASEVEKYRSISLVLRDAAGTEIDRIEESGLNLVCSSVYNFAFDTPLPLLPGEVNPFSVDITLGDDTSTLRGEVRNLSFEPSRRVVLEEISGAECANCPLGLNAIENIEKLYPGKLLPVVLRTYQSDPLGTGMGSYTNFLGLSAAPSARINRGDIVFPMVNNDGDYMLSGAGYKDSQTGEDIVTWLDVFRDELATPTDADIDFISKYDEATKAISVDFSVRSALNKTNTPVNIFAVITENGCETYQVNNVANVEDPDLGEWGKGGIYGSSLVYPYSLDDVGRGSYGTTFAGTGGLVPAQMKAGETYTGNLSFNLPSTVSNPANCEVTLMLIDSGTLRILNANRCRIDGSTVDESGVSAPVAGGADGAPVIVCDGSAIVARAAEGAVTAEAYTVDGRLLASATGDVAVLNLEGYTGLVIVRATADSGAVATSKFIIR